MHIKLKDFMKVMHQWPEDRMTVLQGGALDVLQDNHEGEEEEEFHLAALVIELLENVETHLTEEMACTDDEINKEIDKLEEIKIKLRRIANSK